MRWVVRCHHMSAASVAADRMWPGRHWWVVAGLLAIATGVALAVDQYVTLTSQAMLYVLAVVVASYRLPWIPSAVCALAAVTLLNFFFVPPRWTFQVEAPENFTALAVMLVVALVISHLGTALRRETDTARLNERRARQLQELASELAGAGMAAEVLALAQHYLSNAFTGPCYVALLQPDGEPALPPERASLRDGMLAAIREAATLGPGTGRWPGLDAWYLPLGTKGAMGGAACVRNVSAYDHGGREHAQAVCTMVGQALWRLQLTASMLRAQEESQWHRVQSTFLAAVSHDLRTPLAAIMGAASALQAQRKKLPESEQERLAASIVDEARYLSNVAENTLQLARLAHSAELDMDWQSIEEVVGAVLARVRERDATRRIKSRVPAGLPLIKADPVLLTQLLENLLDNALKYSAGPIDLVVSQADGQMRIAVDDRGAGITPGDEQFIFEPYRRSDRSGQRGAGLGLAVCRAIALAHGGSVQVHPRAGGGASFVVALPIEVTQPAHEAA
jgi:two-component system, OmpR family, sensor histidine kinase KdpD